MNNNIVQEGACDLSEFNIVGRCVGVMGKRLIEVCQGTTDTPTPPGPVRTSARLLLTARGSHISQPSVTF